MPQNLSNAEVHRDVLEQRGDMVRMINEGRIMYQTSRVEENA
jgi:hypothetical protein